MIRSCLFLLLGLTACSARADLAADRAELLRLHELARAAHLQKQAHLLVATFADSFLNISRGAVAVRSPAENRTRLQRYFNRVNFEEWDDLTPPRIRISPDGQMAYVIVEKSVRLVTDSAGVRQAEHTIFAWLEAYEKRDGKWTLMAVASTDRPGDA